MKIYLETNRLILREFKPEDRALLTDLDSDPEVMRHLTYGQPSSDSEIDRAVGVMLDWKVSGKGKYGYWIALDKKSMEFVGWFHLRPLKEYPNDFDTLELGYRLKKKFWGTGLATEGSKALVEKGFEELNAKVICAHTVIDNKGSQRVMEKVGMQFDRNDTYEPYPGPDKRTVWYKIENPN